jgi:PAS domain S-box-containing protein
MTKKGSMDIGIAQHLSRRLFPLASLIGLLLSFGTPLTYWGLEHRNLQHTTTLLAEGLADKFRRLALDSPEFWKYQTHKFNAISEEFHPLIDVDNFRILDEKGVPIAGYEYKGDWIKRGKKLSFTEEFGFTLANAPIIFNNRRIGTVEILACDNALLRTSALIFCFSTLIGTSLTLLIYRYPVRVVRKLEKTQKELVATLQKSEFKYRSLVQNIPDVVWTSDQAGNTVFISPNLERVYGFTPAEVCTGGEALWFGRIHPDDRERVRESYETLFGQGGIFDIEYRIQRKDGEWIWLRDRATGTYENDGITYADGLFADISARKRAEDALVAQARELARSNAELEQFAYVASHDLQEPLRMVASYLQLLSRRYRGKLDTEADEFIAFAVDGATRMQRLINDLLLYSRVGSKGKEPQPTDSHAGLRHALDNLQETIKESGVMIDAAPLPMVMGDEVQLIQLFQNLIANAIKFHGDDSPRVEVKAEPHGGEWLFSVRDNGIGIEAKNFARIFLIFQRLHDRASYPGTGIGLAVCKKIVERLGGRIWVKSELKQGTTFYFTLARVKGDIS